jgi:predicted O-methyltransferase YrrM
MTDFQQSSAGKLAELSIYHNAVQKMKELAACIELIKKQPVPQRILEIGTDNGGTFWLWCQLASPRAHIISLDLPKAKFSSEKGYNKGLLKSYAKPSQVLSFIRKDSHTDKAEAMVRKALDSNMLDLLFIDGDHSYAGVKEDYTRYLKYVRPGGMIIFHDIVIHDKVQDCQVHRFWNELKVENEVYEFIDAEADDRGWGTWGGLGVLIKH